MSDHDEILVALRRITRAMTFTEGVPPGDESDGLFIIHGHTTEGDSNVAS